MFAKGFKGIYAAARAKFLTFDGLQDAPSAE